LITGYYSGCWCCGSSTGLHECRRRQLMRFRCLHCSLPVFHYRIPLQKSLPRPTIHRQKSAPAGGCPGGSDFCRWVVGRRRHFWGDPIVERLLKGLRFFDKKETYQICDYLSPGGFFLYRRHFNVTSAASCHHQLLWSVFYIVNWSRLQNPLGPRLLAQFTVTSSSLLAYYPLRWELQLIDRRPDPALCSSESEKTTVPWMLIATHPDRTDSAADILHGRLFKRQKSLLKSQQFWSSLF